jgi:hypothetical protein
MRSRNWSAERYAFRGIEELLAVRGFLDEYEVDEEVSELCQVFELEGVVFVDGREEHRFLVYVVAQYFYFSD